MENLSLLEKEALGILRQLEYCCDSMKATDPEKIRDCKFFEVHYVIENRSIVKKLVSKHNIENYFKGEGIDIRLGYEFEQDSTGELIQEGMITCDSAEEITAKVKGLIRKLTSKSSNKTTSISFSATIGKLIFNEKDEVFLEGKQQDITSCLVINNAWNSKIGVAEIHDYIKRDTFEYSELSGVEKKNSNDSIRNASKEVNKKTKEFLKDKKLISYKGNAYWLESEIKMNKDE